MTGDLIVVKNAEPEDINGETAVGAQDGDIISFFDPDSEKQSVLTHRCVKVNDDGTFTTKGDNNNAEDPTPCPPENLIGTYITRVPGAGNIAMWLQTTPGLIVCVAVPIILLVAYDLIMKKRYDKTKKKDTDALLAELESLRAQQAEADNKAESKAEAAEEKAEDVQAQKKEEPAKKKNPAEEKTAVDKDKVVASEPEAQAQKAETETQEVPEAEDEPVKAAEDKPAVEKAEDNPAGDNMTTAVMTAEELEEFRQFQEFQKMKKAQQEAAEKPSDPEDKA